MNMTGLAMYLGDGTKQVTDLNNLLFSQHAVSPHLQLVCLFAYLAYMLNVMDFLNNTRLHL